MATQYIPAPDVKEIAEKLIKEHHPDIAEFRMEFVFVDKTPNKGGKEVWGTMRKVSALPAYLAADDKDQADGYTEPFFVMVISKPIWENLPDDKKVALVDHELCHAGVKTDKDGNPKPHIIPHDLEEFTAIVKRHGLWRDDVKEFLEVAKKKS